MSQKFQRWASLPLDHHVRDFVAALESTAKPQQVKLARERVERVIAAIGCTKIEQITPSRVVAVVGAFRKVSQRDAQCGKTSGKNPESSGEPLAVMTKKYYLQTMRQFTRWLVSERRSEYDVLSGLNLRHVSRMWVTEDDVGESTRDRFTDEEIQKLLVFVGSDSVVVKGLLPLERYRAYRIAVNTGLRRTELSRMTPSWVDLEAKTLTIPAGKGKAKRLDVVTLPVEFAEWLGTWLPSLPLRQEILPRLRAVNTAEVLREDLRRAGSPTEREGRELDFHCLRHSFCTRLWEQGLSVAEAVGQARHSDPKLTIKYTHVDRDRLRGKLGGGL